ncbi:MAG: VOC family protein, partial [Alphaproteobacteria bacterium]|nr:VOC family protein [Alphaproteobacteria bacterium]
HVLIAAADLEHSAQVWRRLGFTLTPYGRHIGKPTANYCIMFPNDYVELLGIVDEAAPFARHDRLVRQRGDGLLASALAPSDAEAALEAVRAAGLEPSPLRDLHRKVERPDGPADLYFKNFDVDPGATPDFRMFFCAHLTPDEMRHPDWLEHANGVIGLRGYCVASANPGALAEAYGKLFGAGAITMTDEVLTIFCNGYRILFAKPVDLRALYPEVEQIEDRLPHGAVVSFRVRSNQGAAEHLRQAGVDFVHADDGGILLPAREATGVLVEFREGD